MVAIRSQCGWLVGVALVCGFAVATRAGWRWLDKSEGNSEEVFSRIQVGMSQPQVVGILRTFDASSGRESQGVTTDGRSFRTCHYDHPAMDNLPPPRQIELAVLEALDSYGREIKVRLGRGGTVSSKRLSPGVWEYRWRKVHRVLLDHELNGAWALALVLLVASLWAWYCWSRRFSLPRRPGPSLSAR